MKPVWTILIGLLAHAHIAVSAVLVTFDTSADKNLFQYGMIGQHGSTGAAAHNFINWEEGFVRLSSRYAQPVSRFLIIGGEANNGKFDTTLVPVTSEITYSYYNGNTSNAFAEVALNAKSASGANNYPVYYARVAINEFQLYRHQAYNTLTIVDSFTLPSTLSGENYTLSLTGVNTSGTVLDLTAEFYENETLLASLNYKDLNGFLSGYVGFAGGDAFNSNVIRGIEITEFLGGSPIPEPGVLTLLLLGTCALFILQESKISRFINL